MIRILGIVGSLRARSYNRALLRAAQEDAPAGVEVEIWDIGDIPFYNGDVEAQGDPEPVARFKAAIRSADALLIATPEYNRGLPGVLKNAIDWASRPPLGPPLAGKPVGTMGASTGQGGTGKAQAHLRDVLGFPRARVLPDVALLVADAYAKFDDNGELTDEATRRAVRALLERLRDSIAEPASMV